MGTKILTKTDAQMENAMLSVGDDPERADALAKARAFKRTWLELAEALQRVTTQGTWARWGYPDFETYCRRELHLRGNTVQKLLGSYRFLESAAPRVIERAREPGATTAAIPSISTIDFVKRATEAGHADEATMETMHRVAFDEGAEPTFLKKQFADVAFPVSSRERKDKLRGAIVMTAKRLSSLICENESPLPKALAKRLEETLGELQEALDTDN